MGAKRIDLKMAQVVCTVQPERDLGEPIRDLHASMSGGWVKEMAAAQVANKETVLLSLTDANAQMERWKWPYKMVNLLDGDQPFKLRKESYLAVLAWYASNVKGVKYTLAGGNRRWYCMVALVAAMYQRIVDDDLPNPAGEGQDLMTFLMTGEDFLIPAEIEEAPESDDEAFVRRVEDNKRTGKKKYTPIEWLEIAIRLRKLGKVISQNDLCKFGMGDDAFSGAKHLRQKLWPLVQLSMQRHVDIAEMLGWFAKEEEDSKGVTRSRLERFTPAAGRSLCGDWRKESIIDPIVQEARGSRCEKGKMVTPEDYREWQRLFIEDIKTGSGKAGHALGKAAFSNIRKASDEESVGYKIMDLILRGKGEELTVLLDKLNQVVDADGDPIADIDE